MVGFGELRHLIQQPLAEEARALLKKLSEVVYPLMIKHKWTVPLLSEFLPSNPNLLGLNVNRGQEIRIRLRHPHDIKRFLEYEDLVGTMLHELTHNVIGPHNADFYKFLDDLNDEFDTISADGHARHGFHAFGPGGSVTSTRSAEYLAFTGSGQKLGTTAPGSLNAKSMRERALAAAQRRNHLNASSSSTRDLKGGYVLGGSGSDLAKVLSPREMAIYAAHERYLRDRVWCGCDQNYGNVTATQPPAPVVPKKEIVFIDLTKDDDEIEVIDLTSDA